ISAFQSVGPSVWLPSAQPYPCVGVVPSCEFLDCGGKLGALHFEPHAQYLDSHPQSCLPRSLLWKPLLRFVCPNLCLHQILILQVSLALAPPLASAVWLQAEKSPALM
ncbi:unnamed protein product, partial [Choristocarpus tenellus]